VIVAACYSCQLKTELLQPLNKWLWLQVSTLYGRTWQHKHVVHRHQRKMADAAIVSQAGHEPHCVITPSHMHGNMPRCYSTLANMSTIKQSTTTPDGAAY
jgi:hypothetical protein